MIIAELAEHEWIIDVEQAATCQVTIINGGGIVATFAIQVEGVAQSWVAIAPPEVNLNEGERTTVTVTITPLRHPSSRAGTHPIAIVVTSPNYPDHRSQRSATLTINPYYDFAVGELSPRQQSVGGRRPVGNTVFSVANLGNSQAPFRFEARDDERACNFEFELPGETATLAHQVEMRLPPAGARRRSQSVSRLWRPDLWASVAGCMPIPSRLRCWRGSRPLVLYWDRSRCGH